MTYFNANEEPRVKINSTNLTPASQKVLFHFYSRFAAVEKAFNVERQVI